MKRKILTLAAMLLFCQTLTYAQASSSSTGVVAAVKAFIIELPSLIKNIHNEAQLLQLQGELGDLKDGLDRVSTKKQQIATRVRSSDLQNKYVRQFLIKEIRKVDGDVKNIVKSLNAVKELVQNAKIDRALNVVRDSMQVRKEDILQKMISNLQTIPFKLNKDQITIDANHAKELADNASLAIDDLIDKINEQLARG